jgi:hypothetical protein
MTHYKQFCYLHFTNRWFYSIILRRNLPMASVKRAVQAHELHTQFHCLTPASLTPMITSYGFSCLPLRTSMGMLYTSRCICFRWTRSFTDAEPPYIMTVMCIIKAKLVLQSRRTHMVLVRKKFDQ